MKKNDVVNAGTNNRYADGIDIRLVNLEPIVFFVGYKLTTSLGKHLDDINHAHIVSLMYELLTSATDTVDLSIGFDRDHGRRQQELTNNKNTKDKHHVRIKVKDVFGFSDCQEKATFGLGYKIKLTSSSDNSVLNKDKASNNGKSKVNSIEMYVPHYTASIPQQAILAK